MSNIFLKFFGGMVPRMGEQHLKRQKLAETGIFHTPPQGRSEALAPRDVHATEASNVNLYSGELRPLTKPARAHEFPRPGDDDFYAPAWDDPSFPPETPPAPPECVEPGIDQAPVFMDYQIGQTAAYSVISTGTTPLQYQWFTDGKLIPGEVGPAITFEVTESNVRSRIRVGVANACGSVYTSDIPVSLTG